MKKLASTHVNLIFFISLYPLSGLICVFVCHDEYAEPSISSYISLSPRVVPDFCVGGWPRSRVTLGHEDEGAPGP